MPNGNDEHVGAGANDVAASKAPAAPVVKRAARARSVEDPNAKYGIGEKNPKLAAAEAEFQRAVEKFEKAKAEVQAEAEAVEASREGGK